MNDLHQSENGLESQDLEKLGDEILQRYFDGDLDEAEASDFERELEASAELQGQLRSLGRLREALMASAEEGLVDFPDGDELFASIQGTLEGEKKLGRQNLELLEGGLSAHPPSAAPTPIRRGGVRTYGVVLALAAAAVLAVLTLGGEDEVAVTPAPEPDVAVEDGTIALIENTPAGSEVLEVDFGGNTGTVFNIEGSSGQPIAVVWISDDKPETEL